MKTDRGTLTQLRLWLQENIEFEDYLIKEHGDFITPKAQRACWYSVLEKMRELQYEELQRREEEMDKL